MEVNIEAQEINVDNEMPESIPLPNQNEINNSDDNITQKTRAASEDEIIEQHYEKIRNSENIEVFVQELLEETPVSQSALNLGCKYTMLSR